jgi:ABC-type branched-subunit amino acid transport system ATPase component
MSMLSIAGLRAGYGKIEVLHEVALTIEQGRSSP